MGYTDKIVYLAEHEVAVRHGRIRLASSTATREKSHHSVQNARFANRGTSIWAATTHFMLKEIFEQPETIRRHARPPLRGSHRKLGGLDMTPRTAQASSASF